MSKNKSLLIPRGKKTAQNNKKAAAGLSLDPCCLSTAHSHLQCTQHLQKHHAATRKENKPTTLCRAPSSQWVTPAPCTQRAHKLHLISSHLSPHHFCRHLEALNVSEWKARGQDCMHRTLLTSLVREHCLST